MEIQLKAQPLIEALFSEVNPIPVKKALNLMGMEAGPLRSPLTEMTDANAANLRKHEELWDQAGVRGSGTRKARFEKTPEMLVCSVSGVALNKEKRGKTT